MKDTVSLALSPFRGHKTTIHVKRRQRRRGRGAIMGYEKKGGENKSERERKFTYRKYAAILLPAGSWLSSRARAWRKSTSQFCGAWCLYK